MAKKPSPKVQKLLAKQMRGGRYKSESDVLLDALELLDLRNSELDAHLEAMRAGVRRGLADSKAGRTVPSEEVTVESIRALAKFRAGQRKLRKSA
jgi:Arc/MetJ-type ribon-helix-helix transcriptional regulator